MAFQRSKYIRFLIPVFIGLSALAIPLIRDFHIESALLAAFVGCFWGGLKTCKKVFRDRDAFQALSILGYLYLFGFPLLIYSLATGCFNTDGLGFWLLYPIPSVFFGYAVGRLVRIWSVPFQRLSTVLILLAISIGVLLIEFYSFPQVYFYNHVWGGWPGPIYDETVQITGSLIYFRTLTLLWIIVLWFIPDFKKGNQAKGIVIIAVIALLFCYTQLSEFGIISPRSSIQNQLGGVKETPNFKLYYADNFYTEGEVERLALEHEFYLDEISRKLEISKPDSTQKIESYLYAHPWQKKKLVGAKFTSYVPVWLNQDQLHIAKQQISGSLEHELVHVLAKQFGNKLFNASWSIGLIEGLAVALSPDESRTSTIDQIVVSEKPLPTASEMKHALSPIGFYGGRSAVNYTTSGSFVSFLLDNYPIEEFKQAYRTGSISQSYSDSFESLVQGWHNRMASVTVDSIDQQVAQRLFSIPSLFEKECPHIISDFANQWDHYQFHLAEGDTVEALKSLDQVYKLKPENLFVKSEWTYMNLEKGNVTNVLRRASLKDSTFDLQLLYADAFMMAGLRSEADHYLQQGKKLIIENPDSTSMVALKTRHDSLQWAAYRDLTYYNKLFEAGEFRRLLYRTKIRTIEKTIKEEQWGGFRMYSQILSESDADTKYFDTYMAMVHALGYLREWQQAEHWLEKIGELDLRERYLERLQKQSRWIAYLQENNTAS